MSLVKIKTNLGDFTLSLDEQRAPKSVANFLAYVNSGHYNGTIFHRVIDRFMIQGGHFKPGMEKQDTNKPIDNEAKNGLRNDKYAIAMARTMQPHSASDQFFINTKDNDFLNYPGQDGWGYAVFGKVVEGTDVIDQIGKVRTTRSGLHSDVPAEDVVILSAEVVTELDKPTETATQTPVAAATTEQQVTEPNDDEDLPDMADDFVDELLAVFSFGNFISTADLAKYGEQVVAAQRQVQEANRNLYMLLNDKVAELKTAG